MPTRPPSVHSTASSTDSEDCDENYVAMVSNMSTDEPVCNTQPSSDYKKLHDYIFLYFSNHRLSTLHVWIDFHCDMCFFLWFVETILHHYCIWNLQRQLHNKFSRIHMRQFSGLNTCNLESRAVFVTQKMVEIPFPKAYVNMDELLVAADGLLATSTLLFAVSSYPATLLPLFFIFVLVLFRSCVL